MNITANRVFEDSYDLLDRQRELILRMWKDLPVDQTAVMTNRQAREYLGVSRASMMRWEEQGLLTPIIAPNSYRYYLLGHLWVFKTLWLDADDGR